MRPASSDKWPSSANFLRWCRTALVELKPIKLWMSLIDGVAPVVSTTVSMWRSIRCVDSSVIIIVVGRSSESHSPNDPPSLTVHCYSGPPPLIVYGWMDVGFHIESAIVAQSVG